MKCGAGAIWYGFQNTSESTSWNIASEAVTCRWKKRLGYRVEYGRVW